MTAARSPSPSTRGEASNHRTVFVVLALALALVLLQSFVRRHVELILGLDVETALADLLVLSSSSAPPQRQQDEEEEDAFEVSDEDGVPRIKGFIGAPDDATTPLLPKAQDVGLPARAIHQWCPTASCHVTELCHPCKRRYLLLLATGRSGSTTLQHMLYALPGIRMSGENNGMLGNLYNTLHATMHKPNWQWAADRRDRDASWFHYAYPSSAFACVTQQMVETVTPPPNHNGQRNVSALDPKDEEIGDEREMIVGFKTIRFPPNRGNTTAKELQRVLRFLTEHAFPCARIVMNVRSNVASQAESMRRGWVGHHKLDDLEHEAAAFNALLHRLYQRLGPQRSYWLDSSEWTRNVSHINKLVSWLGFDEQCHFDRPFQFNTKGLYKAGNVTNRPNPPGCRKLPW